MNVIVDTNVIISAMIKDSATRFIILNTEHKLIFPEFEFKEIVKHKQEILKKSGISEENFKKLLKLLLKHVLILNTKDCEGYCKEAEMVIGRIDPDDVIFIASALACDAAVWSDDKHFQKQKRVKVFTTREMFEVLVGD